MFKTVDASLMGISNFAFDVLEANKGWTEIALFFEAWIIYFLYLFVSTYFLIIFTVSIFGAHMMIIVMPITISLYPFKKFRHYTTNCVNGMLHYGLVTIFACVAISLVVYITNDLVKVSQGLRDVAENTQTELKIPADFLTGSIMIGFLSIFIIKISTEFASRVLNTATSQLGGAFPMIVAGATTLARSSATFAKAAPPVIGAAASIGSYSARGVGVASSAATSGARFIGNTLKGGK